MRTFVVVLVHSIDSTRHLILWISWEIRGR